MYKNKRALWIFWGSISLVAGFLLYVFFRQNTYIAQFVLSYFPALRSDYASRFPQIRHLSYYLADYLWAFSLSCGLHAIFLPGKSGTFCCTLAVSLLGIIYEILQCVRIISGTGDITDILLYVLAGCTVNIIYLLRRETHENKQTD